MLDLREMKVLVTGASGFLGRHMMRALARRGAEALPWPRSVERNMLFDDSCDGMFSDAYPDVVIHLAAKCGGIGANMQRPAEFIADNLRMGLNIIDACHKYGVKKLVMVGTICSYPETVRADSREYDEPGGPRTAIKESDIWEGYPEPTNAPYGIAKRTIIEVGKAYHAQYGLNVVNVLPANMYGPGDNFDPETSHVIPAMIRCFADAVGCAAKSVTCWGTGRPTRDFLHVRDACEGILRAAERLETPDPVNLGTGLEISIRSLAAAIAATVGYSGAIEWDHSKPDGQPRRCLGTETQKRLLDFEPSVSLADGLRETVTWYLENR